MITIFNRAKVYSTFNMGEQANIRDALRAADVGYYLKVINLEAGSVFSTTRSRGGSFGMSPKFTHEYVFYVHKKDKEKAEWIISTARRQGR